MLVLRSREDFAPKQQPIRRIEKMADEILQTLSPRATTSAASSKLVELGVMPHIAQDLERNGGSAIDGRTTRPIGDGVSQRIRKPYRLPSHPPCVE